MTRRPTLADVAAAAGVSPSTASVVFSRKAPVADATRARVLVAAAELGYTGPDPFAASLRTGRSGIVGVVLEEHLGVAFLDPVMTLTMDGLADAVAPLGAGLLLLPRGSGLATAPIDAAVLIGVGEATRGSVETLRARGIPLVAIEGDAGEGVPRIELDNRDAQRRAAEHLRDLGHAHVAIVTLPPHLDLTRDRLAGAREVYPDAPVHAAGGSLIDEGLAAGRAILADPRDRPTAVIAQSDLLAAGVIRAAEERGLRVPADLSVTGFDGITVDGLAPYELTTLVQPAAEKGRAAGAAVAALLEGRDAAGIRFTCAFRAGGTTAPPAARR